MFADKHKDERRGLIADFREHFREYDLQEEQIFARFNADVQDTVKEKNKLYGDPRKFLVTLRGVLAPDLAHLLRRSHEAQVHCALLGRAGRIGARVHRSHGR